MPLDYERIRRDNLVRYGTDVADYGTLFFNDTYADRTHFIFELLQNAEDAISRKKTNQDHAKQVSLSLTREYLRFEHFGAPFNESDVRGITGIAKSTKVETLTQIGRFGIGFKSVYAYTNRPEIHSGKEAFAIENYVWPVAVEPLIDKADTATVILLPFDTIPQSAFSEIDSKLKHLNAQTLLFLQHIDEIRWDNDQGESGHYIRESENVDEDIQSTTIIGETDGEQDIYEEWLMFRRPVFSEQTPAGAVTIAYSIDPDQTCFRSLSRSTLCVYFPTELETRFGFLANGPYRTTLSRENVPSNDAWNRYLVDETAALLTSSLQWLKDNKRLNASVLRCLPLTQWDSQWRQTERNLLQPMFAKTKSSLLSERLIPGLGETYISANQALIGRTAALRGLFSKEQLSAIYGRELSWIDDTVIQDEVLWNYLTYQLNVREIRPETIIRDLTAKFLESQVDEWILSLYEFLSGQSALVSQLTRVPIVRLSDGKHVVVEAGGKRLAYLPPTHHTDFPTVAKNVCNTAKSLKFLIGLGLTEPNSVDDVFTNVIPKYVSDSGSVDIDAYETDIQRILKAFDSATGSQCQKLIGELSKTKFIRVSDTASSPHKQWCTPAEIYLPTEELKLLFSGVRGVWFVDEAYEFLHSDNFCRLLEACGAGRNIQPIPFNNPQRFDENQRQELRGGMGSTRSESVEDWKLMGLSQLLATLPHLDPTSQTQRAALLWKALAKLENIYFLGTFRWFYYEPRSNSFDSEFVNLLNNTAWVPIRDRNLKRPDVVAFDKLNWPESKFLQSVIKFKPSEVQELAQAIGIELGLLELIKALGLTEDIVRDTFDKSQSQGAGDLHVGDHDIEPSREFPVGLLETMTADPTDGPSSPVIPPPVGPLTAQSAVDDTKVSVEMGGVGKMVTHTQTRFEPTSGSRALAGKFRSMLQGDYRGRCQICGRSFLTRNGEFQSFSDHVVDPHKALGTNHFGNLLSLCGWHYALISYGQWVLLHPESREPLKGSQDVVGLKDIVKSVGELIGTEELFVAVPIRFWNVYPEWEAEPESVDGVLRFSMPHWEYLCALVNV